MHMYLKRNEKNFVIMIALIFLTISIAGRFLLGEMIFAILITFAVTILLVFQLELNHRTYLRQNKARWDDYRQMESLFSIFSLLKINAPLPAMRDWAASPDLLKIIVNLIYENKPKLILELSSGISTLITAYSLKNLREGRVVSLEQDYKYVLISQNNLVNHGLQDIAKVIHAPLKEIEVNGKKMVWYDTAPLNALESIDMIIIDGPRGSMRYPALPVLFDRLNNNGIIISDDASRESGRKDVELWIKDFNCLIVERIPTEKGTLVIRKRKDVDNTGSSIHSSEQN